jgi:hypothetical protein
MPLPVRTYTNNEVLREVFSDSVEALQGKSVSLYPPPICDHSLGSTITSRICSFPSTMRRPKW